MKRLVALAVILPSFGCSGFVAARGTDLHTLETREQVRKEFGAPTATGGGEQPFDEYRTHRKLSEKWKGTGICMAFVMTAGLSELYFFPRELLGAAAQRVRGHTLRFVYDAEGNLVAVDGASSPWVRCRPPEKATPLPAAHEAPPAPGPALNLMDRVRRLAGLASTYQP